MTHKIAALRMQRNQRRVTAQMEDGRTLTLAAILAAPLRVGQPLDDAQITRLEREDLLEDGFQRSLALIARRPRSRAELETYLRRRKLDAATISEVIERLAQRGFINDAEFARAWVENRQSFRPRSRRVLQAELRKRGVTEDDSQPALEGVREHDAALAAARKRAQRLAGHFPGDDRQARFAFEKKIIAFLAMRGFEFDLARDTARQVWQEAQAGDGRAEIPSEEESEDER